jgi:lipoprotein-anchoring transpeptidase ErfK/SrfK
VLAILILVNITLLFLVYSNIFVYPNTYLGNIPVSGETARQIEQLVLDFAKMKPAIQVKNRRYTYSYDQLGVIVDANKAMDDVFAPNKKFFPLNLINFFQSLSTKQVIGAPLAFTQNFDQFVADTTFSFSLLPDNVSVDPATKSLMVTENDETYRFDKTSLQSLLISHFGQNSTPIYPMLAKVTNQTISQIADINQKLAAVFGSPMMVYLDLGGSTQTVELKEEDLREAVTVTYEPLSVNAGLSVSTDALNRVLTRRVHESGFPIRNNLVTQNVVSDFTKAITLRLGGANVNAVSTVPGAGPTTNGTLADKYIEIDITQAKMYLFQSGKVVKSYTVSTGLDYPTPTGRFEILNKTGLGYSDIYQDWLPWWMGFAYSKELNAYFGIHEQPYRLTADGKIVAAAPQAIGIPSTGGCVALAPGAAQAVYAFADIGTPVYIYN